MSPGRGESDRGAGMHLVSTLSCNIAVEHVAMILPYNRFFICTLLFSDKQLQLSTKGEVFGIFFVKVLLFLNHTGRFARPTNTVSSGTFSCQL